MMSCPACNSKVYRQVRQLSRATVVVCESCGLAYCEAGEEQDDTNVIDTDPNFFHGIREAFSDQVEVARQIVPVRLAAYQRLLGRPVQSILEIGCATGAYASAYTECGVRYVGLEIEAGLAQAAKDNTEAEIFQGNFLEEHFSDEFDVVFASQVFEHIVTPKAFLEKAAEVTPRGLIHIDVPNHNSLAASIRKVVPNKDYGFIQPPYHMIAYNKKSLSALAKRAGLDALIIEAKRNDDPIWGQLVSSLSVQARVMYAAAGLLKSGSLLTLVATANR